MIIEKPIEKHYYLSISTMISSFIRSYFNKIHLLLKANYSVYGPTKNDDF